MEFLPAFKPIGFVRSSRKKLVDDKWDSETTSIELDPAQFKPEVLHGLDQFSHAEIIFFMHASTAPWEPARHPRGNPAWPKAGLFAQRVKDRPNRLGLTICQIKKIEDLNIVVSGLDAMDGTPILDIKPWVKEFGPRGHVTQPPWMTELMADYW